MSAGPLIRALASSRSTLVNNVRHSSYKPPANWKPVHLDEMPVPQGSWKAAYDARQKNYNLQLGAGIAIFLVTMGVVTQSDIIFFNARIPPLPENE